MGISNRLNDVTPSLQSFNFHFIYNLTIYNLTIYNLQLIFQFYLIFQFFNFSIFQLLFDSPTRQPVNSSIFQLFNFSILLQFFFNSCRG